MPLPKNKERYTFQDYLQWPDDERWEIIDGIAYNMTPAPSRFHQIIVVNLVRILGNHLLNHPCVLHVSPTDVLFSEEDVVQPDVFVVCDSSKFKDANIQGAPDLIFEILSPSTSLKDRREKKRLYEKNSVKEYILLDPVGFTAERFELKTDGLYGEGKLFGENETLPLNTISLELVLADIFKNPGKEGQNNAASSK